MTPPPAVLARLIAEARREYRDSDAAGDVLDWLEEQVGSLAQQGEAVPLGYMAASSIDALNACRHHASNGYAEVWMRASDVWTVPVFTHPAAVDADGQSAMWALRQILHDLPTRRDWLCPDVEKVARAIVARNPYADLTAALQPAATSEGENNV